jgi:hypothetical protein
MLRIRITLDERLDKYRLDKLSCGGAVGQGAMILPWLKGRSVNDILATGVNDFLQQNPAGDDIEEFLFIKHFLAVRQGLLVMIGVESGSKADWCVVDSVEHSPEGIVLRARLKVDGMTDEIKACSGGCRTA